MNADEGGNWTILSKSWIYTRPHPIFMYPIIKSLWLTLANMCFSWRAISISSGKYIQGNVLWWSLIQSKRSPSSINWNLSWIFSFAKCDTEASSVFLQNQSELVVAKQEFLTFLSPSGNNGKTLWIDFRSIRFFADQMGIGHPIWKRSFYKSLSSPS